MTHLERKQTFLFILGGHECDYDGKEKLLKRRQIVATVEVPEGGILMSFLDIE